MHYFCGKCGVWYSEAEVHAMGGMVVVSREVGRVPRPLVCSCCLLDFALDHLPGPVCVDMPLDVEGMGP